MCCQDLLVHNEIWIMRPNSTSAGLKMTQWSASSWQSKVCKQQPSYKDPEALREALVRLSQLPPLVTSPEILSLKSQLAEAARGERFILQGGDCAESFAETSKENIANKLKILLQMSLVLLYGLRKPITRVGRIAGQFAKPRSQPTEERDGVILPSYRGDLVNSPEFEAIAREPDPNNMIRGYMHSAMTLNYIRSWVSSGFADLHHPEKWDLDFVKHSPQSEYYHQMTNAIGDSIDFIKSFDGIKMSSFREVEFFTSHEALLLPYEQGLTGQAEDGHWYDFSTHFPWIGMRTAEVDSAHIEYFRGINNPVGIKVGPSVTPEWIAEITNIINPHNEPGRLTFITRFGADKIATCLPPLIQAVNKLGASVLWTCDPMHGNTQSTSDGIKTRRFDDILSELNQAFQIHQENNSHLGGVHFELTGEDVTECIGGARGVSEADLKRAYKSLVDPRLNYEQALEMAMSVVHSIGK